MHCPSTIIIILLKTLMVHMQYSLFGSILNFGAMIGAITSGRIADFTGRKGVSYSNYTPFTMLRLCRSFYLMLRVNLTSNIYRH